MHDEKVRIGSHSEITVRLPLTMTGDLVKVIRFPVIPSEALLLHTVLNESSDK